MNKIEEEINSLEEQVEPILERISKLKQQLVELKSQFKIGDVITWNRGTKTGKVIGIQTWVCEKPMWNVRRIKKDGSFGSVVNVYTYSEPTLVTPNQATVLKP